MNNLQQENETRLMLVVSQVTKITVLRVLCLLQ